MTAAHRFDAGMLGGAALFFILERIGVIEQWFEKRDR
jgi:hypothetical protein